MAGGTFAYFAFAQSSPKGWINLFVFKLEDDARISEARAILADTSNPHRRVEGTIARGTVPYNPNWSFHLDPSTISFFEINIEVCDGNASYVEEHLDEIGGSTLPNGFWCPWSSHLLAEVSHLIDPSTERLRL